MPKKQQICYILPKFDLSTDTHHYYLYDLINRVAAEINIALIIENSKSDVSYFSNVKEVVVQEFAWKPLRTIELFLILVRKRLSGYKNFYIHYSYPAALVAKLVGGRVWYWNCGMPWLYGRQRLLEKVLQKIDYLVTGNKTMAGLYNKIYKVDLNKIKTMPNWIDMDRFRKQDVDKISKKYDLLDDKKYVLFIHHLSGRKGAHYLPEISQKLKDITNLEVIVAGDGPYKQKLEKEIKDLDNIRLLGRVPNREIPALLQASFLLLMPSDEEGMPRVLLEAMAAGLPYVASDIGGVRGMTADSAAECVCRVGDIDCFVKVIKKLFFHPDFYEKIRQANLTNVKNYQIDKVVKIFLNLFQDE